MKKLLSTLFIILSLVSCDDYEAQDVLPTDRFDGPGIFTGKKGDFEIPIGGSSEEASYKRQKLKS